VTAESHFFSVYGRRQAIPNTRRHPAQAQQPVRAPTDGRIDQPPEPQELLVLDNLGSHKNQAARRATRPPPGRAYILFLPPYSPDLKPIERLFAKLKHLVRSAEPRIFEATWRTAGQILDLFSPAKCANYLKNSEYASV
jgi:transposase